MADVNASPAMEDGTSSPRHTCVPLTRAAWLVLALGLAVRLACVPHPGYERDIYWFGTWMRTAMETGVAHVSEKVWCDYAPGYLYVLEGLGLFWKHVCALDLPADATLGMRFLVKLTPIACDLLLAVLLWRLATRVSGRATGTALAALAATALSPALLVTGAVWGQCDSLIALLGLLAAVAVARGRHVVGFAVLALGVLVKFQLVVLVPVLGLAALLLGARAASPSGEWAAPRAVLRGALAAGLAAYAGLALASFVALAPFFVAHRVDSVIGTAFGAVGRYPNLSMNAHNLWWIVGGADAWRTSDALRVGNAALTAHSLGTLALGAATLVVLARLARQLWCGAGDPLGPIAEACALELLAFYLFPTEMHERYVVPALAFTAAAAIYRRTAWLPHLVLSLSVAASLATTLNAAYPSSFGPLATIFPASRADALALSWIHLAVFAFLLFSGMGLAFTGASVTGLGAAAALVAAVVLLPPTRPARLSDWAPTSARQGWGDLHHDQTVDGGRLCVSGFVFRHGLGTHAESVLTFDLNRRFRTFDTLYGIDDEANRGGAVQFRVVTDGRVAFDGGIQKGWAFPTHAHVDVTGCKELRLEVLDGGDGISSDHADWLDPVLLP